MEDGGPSKGPDLYVVARILERLWREGGPMVKTRLQVAANLNYDVFSKYLTWLEEKGLVAVSTGDGVPSRVEITEKGREAYRRLVSWLDDFVRRQPL